MDFLTYSAFNLVAGVLGVLWLVVFSLAPLYTTCAPTTDFAHATCNYTLDFNTGTCADSNVYSTLTVQYGLGTMMFVVLGFLWCVTLRSKQRDRRFSEKIGFCVVWLCVLIGLVVCWSYYIPGGSTGRNAWQTYCRDREASGCDYVCVNRLFYLGRSLLHGFSGLCLIVFMLSVPIVFKNKLRIQPAEEAAEAGVQATQAK